MDLSANSSTQMATSDLAVENQTVKLTPEQEEELKLRSKYPNPHKPGGSSFVQKMLHKGYKKYFDSGDYNMAKSRSKALGNKQMICTPSTAETTTTQNQIQCDSISNSSLSDSSLSNNCNNNNNNTEISLESISNSPSSNSNERDQNIDEQHTPSLIITSSTISTQPLASNINIINSASSVPSSQASNHHIYLTANNFNNQHSITNSISSNSLMTSSISADKLSSIIHLNVPQTTDLDLLDSDEIGHEIPNPEYIQARKHSLAQSKLAIPRLSS